MPAWGFEERLAENACEQNAAGRERTVAMKPLSATPRRLVALCANVATATLLLLAVPVAHGGRYELVKGKGVEVCEVYATNLNSFQPSEPMLCDRPVSPRFKDLRKPKWERLDFDRNLELIVTVDKLLRPKYFAKPEMRVPSLRGNVEQDNYKYQLMIIDIDNDGKTEPVLRFVESCWPGSSRVGGAALLVLEQSKNDVDLKKSQLIAGDRLDGYSGGIRDVFVHKGKTYFDIWLFRTLNTGQLHVMQTENAETREICQMKFHPK